MYMKEKELDFGFTCTIPVSCDEHSILNLYICRIETGFLKFAFGTLLVDVYVLCKTLVLLLLLLLLILL